MPVIVIVTITPFSVVFKTAIYNSFLFVISSWKMTKIPFCVWEPLLFKAEVVPFFIIYKFTICNKIVVRFLLNEIV